MTCRGTTKSALKTSAPNLNFGAITRDEGPQTKSIVLERGDAGPIHPEVGIIRSANLTATIKEITPGEKYELTATVSPPWPPNALRGSIPIKTGVEESPNDNILTIANLTPRLRASPSLFRLPNDVSKGAELRARMVWAGANPGQVERVEVSDPQLEAHVENVAGLDNVVLVVPPGYEFKGRPIVSVLTTDKATPPLRITVWQAATTTAHTPAPQSTGTATSGVRRVPSKPNK